MKTVFKVYNNARKSSTLEEKSQEFQSGKFTKVVEIERKAKPMIVFHLII
jgi:hypothetical protein